MIARLRRWHVLVVILLLVSVLAPLARADDRAEGDELQSEIHEFLERVTAGGRR